MTPEEKKQEEINNVLLEVLTKEEMDKYNGLGGSLGIMYGLLFSLEKEGILKAFGEDGADKIKTAMEVITIYTQKGIESELTKEKAEEVRQKLIDSNLV